MKNKVLIKLYVLDIDESFDLFIPVNQVMWKIRALITRAVSDLTQISLEGEFALINKDTCKMYGNNEIVRETDIRNATELILVSLRKNIVASNPIGDNNNPFSNFTVKENEFTDINKKMVPLDVNGLKLNENRE